MWRRCTSYAMGAGTILASSWVILDKNTLSDGDFHFLTPPSKRWLHNWDSRHSDNPESSKTVKISVENSIPTATRHIILVRHGIYMTADDGTKGLTELGREQARLTGFRLKESGINFDSLVKSTMSRATQTADLIGEYLPHLAHKSDLMLEEGSPFLADPMGRWHPPSEFLIDGTRIEAAFRKYFYRAAPEQMKDSFELLVCHANVIRYFVCRALQFPPEGWLRLSIAHCSITWISIGPTGQVVMWTFGDHGHLPQDKVTFHHRRCPVENK